MTDPLELRLRVALRWRDMDMLGHLNQSVYHELLEEGRGALLMELAQRLGAGHNHGGWVVRRVELDYLHEVRRDHDEVEIVVRVGRVGNSSLTMTHEVNLPDGTTAAAGNTVLVGWDPRARGKRMISDAERAILGQVDR